MTGKTIEQQIFEHLAEMLEYPRPSLIKVTQECEALVSPGCPEAGALLDEFRICVKETPPGRLEEIYTGTFDLDAVYHPYVGHHLFGETYKRSLFLLGLKERYQAHGFTVEAELPDHLAVMLHFLSVCDDCVLAEELVHEALLPALGQMMGKDEKDQATDRDSGQRDRRAEQRLYWPVLEAVRLVLGQRLTNEQRSMTKEDSSAAGRSSSVVS